MTAKALLSRFLSAGFAIGACSIVAHAGIGALTVPSLEGCSVTLTDGGVILKTQTKYVGDPMTQASTPWTGQSIVVSDGNGQVTVTGDPAATVVTAVAKVFAFADPDKQSDGTAAIQDTAGTFRVSADANQIKVFCNQASQQHGSAGVGTTGCALTVTVPAGSASQGVLVAARSANGEVTATNLTVNASGQADIESSNGNASATQITGGVKVHTDNGDATAGVTPTVGAQIEVSTGNGDATLSVPASFTCDRLALSAPGGMVNVAMGFTNPVTAASTSVGASGTGASAITVTAGSLGNANLRPQ
jgi:hypothetical protein